MTELLLPTIAIIIALFIGILYFFRSRTKALSRRFQHEVQTLRYEMNAKMRTIELRQYIEQDGTETLLYDGRGRPVEPDFRGGAAHAWDYVAHRFGDTQGAGRHETRDSEIAVYRTNTEGRYEIHLLKYLVDGKNWDKIPADDSRKERKLRLCCEVKKETASHQLRFVFKGESSKDVLDEKDWIVYNPEWEKLELVFTVSTQEACALRIDDLHVLQAPSTVKIRNLVLYEKR